MKIGIYGGCFNPPHLTHKMMAEELIRKNYVDTVIYVPVGNQYHKDYLERFNDRYNMLNILFKENSNITISKHENESKQIYTYQTLDYFHNKYINDEIYFICGSDKISEISTWKKTEYILNNYKILVVDREEERLDKHPNIIYTDITLPAMSSTTVRNLISQNKMPLELVDKTTWEYIQKHNLYS